MKEGHLGLRERAGAVAVVQFALRKEELRGEKVGVNGLWRQHASFTWQPHLSPAWCGLLTKGLRQLVRTKIKMTSEMPNGAVLIFC